MLSERLRPVIEPLTAGVGRALSRAHLSPDALTTAGLIAVLGCAAVIARGDAVLGGALLIPAVLLDLLDGAVARASGRVTAWGGYYDSVCDRISDGALLGAVAWSARGAHPASQGRLLGLALVALTLSFVVPYARAKAEALGLKPGSGPGERAERSILLVAGLLFDVMEPALWVLCALAAFTIATRSVAVRRQV